MEDRSLLSEETISNKIYYIRNQKVMLDSDLAFLYGIETKVLKQAVKRNITRFPEDFMFELSKVEYDSSRSQIVTLKNGRGSNLKYLPFAFTEHGVLMLSSVLKSDKAIQTNIQIMRILQKCDKCFLTLPKLELTSFIPKLRDRKNLKIMIKTSNWYFPIWMS
ncbi:ORF6N domain protein [compost metagenome]